MPALSFRLFDAASDAEAARYRILAGLAETRAAFRSNRISPWLGDLVTLHRGLAALVAGAASVETHAGPVVDVDWAAGRLVRSGPEAPVAVGLARWALPQIEGTRVELARHAAAGAAPSLAMDEKENPSVGSEDAASLARRDFDRQVRRERARLKAEPGALPSSSDVAALLDQLAPAPSPKVVRATVQVDETRSGGKPWSLKLKLSPGEAAQGKIVDAWEKQPVLLDRDTMMKLPPELRPAPAPAPA